MKTLIASITKSNDGYPCGWPGLAFPCAAAAPENTANKAHFDKTTPPLWQAARWPNGSAAERDGLHKEGEEKSQVSADSDEKR